MMIHRITRNNYLHTEISRQHTHTRALSDFVSRGSTLSSGSFDAVGFFQFVGAAPACAYCWWFRRDCRSTRPVVLVSQLSCRFTRDNGANTNLHNKETSWEVKHKDNNIPIQVE